MSGVTIIGDPGSWTVTIGEGVDATTYKDLTPGRDLESATERANAVAARHGKSGGSAYTSNVFLFGEKGVARARASVVGGLFGEDLKAAERALLDAGHE